MPSGKTHDKVTYFFVIPTFCLAWFVSKSLLLSGVCCISFMFAGFMFSGDLDTKSVQYKRWGPLKWIWVPYQKMVPHRSPFSHGILLGMMARLAYLTSILTLVFIGVTQAAIWFQWQEVSSQSFEALHSFVGLVVRQPTIFWYALAGLWLGGVSHTFADETVSAWKRRRRKKLKKRTKKRKKV